MLKSVNLLFLIVVLSGCSLKQPSITEYKIEMEEFQKIKMHKNVKIKH